MSDYITRDAAVLTVKFMKEVCDTHNIDDYYELLLEGISQLVPVSMDNNATVPRQGTWKHVGCVEGLFEDYVCSVCNNHPPQQKEGVTWKWDFTRYCPNCGARMDRKETQKDD